MFRISKSCYIDMAHRIRGYKGKCARLHGHTWRIEVSLSCDQLDEMGMVVDFGDIKEWFRGIEANFDHTLVLGKSDYEALERLGVFRSPAGASTPFDVLCQALGYDVGSSDTPRLGIQRVPYNMTAERFAEDLYKSAAKYFTFGGARRVEVDYVRVYEQLHPTESYAEYRPSKTESLNPRGGRPLDVDGEPQ